MRKKFCFNVFLCCCGSFILSGFILFLMHITTIKYDYQGNWISNINNNTLEINESFAKKCDYRVTYNNYYKSWCYIKSNFENALVYNFLFEDGSNIPPDTKIYYVKNDNSLDFYEQNFVRRKNIEIVN